MNKEVDVSRDQDGGLGGGVCRLQSCVLHTCLKNSFRRYRTCSSCASLSRLCGALGPAASYF
jgi:hypothetical protein